MAKNNQRQEWDDCICHHNNTHTSECKRNHRKNYVRTIQKKRRQEKRAKGLCIVPGCNCNGERKIVIHQYCKKHREKLKQKNGATK